MSALIFRLNNVPEDEAVDVRQLLDDNDIDYYETSAGNWGISMPAIWVRQKNQVDQAKRLIENYEQQRYLQAQQDYQNRKNHGQQQTLLTSFLQAPIRFLVYFSAIILILYLSFKFIYELA